MSSGRQTRAQRNAGRISCFICHHRKVRCDVHDSGPPCSNCRAADSVDRCHIYQKRKRQSRRSIETARSQAAQRSSTATAPHAISVKSPFHCRGNHALSDQDSSRNAHATAPAIIVSSQEDLDRAASSCTPRTASDFAEAIPYRKDDAELKSYLVEFIDQPHIAERPIDKGARMMYVGSDLSNTSFLVRQLSGSKMSSGVSHYAANRVARRHTCHGPERMPVEVFQLPTKPVVDALLDAYFTHINPIFPVVDQNLFMEQYQARDSSNPPSLLLLHAILVAGAHVLYRQPERDATKSLFFCRAKTLFDARFERNRDTVVQAALLLTWHADGVEDVLANAWFWVGVAARTAMGLGMHRDADQSTLVPHNKRMWRRLWWLLFQCDVMVSLQYGRPPAIRLDESDVKSLQPSDFDDCGPLVQFEYFIQQTDLCVILSRNIRGQFSLSNSNPTDAMEQSRKLDKELAEWSLQQPAMELRSSNPKAHVASSMSQLLYNAALILIHRGRPDERRINGTQCDDEKICWTAAFAIEQIFHRICEYDQIQCVWVSGVNFLFTAMVQLSVQVKVPNPVVALSAFKQYESTLSIMREVTDVWPNSNSILHFFERFIRSCPSAMSPDKSYDHEESHPRIETCPDFDMSDPLSNRENECSQGPEARPRHTLDLLHNSGDFEVLSTVGIDGVDKVLQAWQDWQISSELPDEYLLTL